jgi:hypothetical protein
MQPTHIRLKHLNKYSLLLLPAAGPTCALLAHAGWQVGKVLGRNATLAKQLRDALRVGFAGAQLDAVLDECAGVLLVGVDACPPASSSSSSSNKCRGRSSRQLVQLINALC